MHHTPRVAILGATGFIGRGLPELLAAHGMACTGVSRAGTGQVPGIDHWQKPENLDVSGHHAVINLAGEPVDCRWTEENRRRLHESRIGTTRRVIAAIRALSSDERPEVLVNASAVGIFGDRGDEILTESSACGTGFLAELCRDWEEAAMEAHELGVRVVRPRIGIVLGSGGAAMAKLLPIFKAGLGGRLGTGSQWMPWIHLLDLRAALVHAVLTESIVGAVNCAAPYAERNLDFTRKLASALHRPAFLPVPGFALKLALGGFGGALLDSQHVTPDALEKSGFSFAFPTLESAFSSRGAIL